MNDLPQPNTGNEAGNASTDSSTASPDGIPTLRMELAVLGAYSNCSDCLQISLLLNSTNVVSDTLLTVIREHRASHFSTHYYGAGTDHDE